jgi:DNA invertase Pin-like site-specific DNA recombinase
METRNPLHPSRPISTTLHSCERDTPPPPTKSFVSYYRVSTDRQGISGLGLEAQQEAVERYIAIENGELVEAFIEIESGKRKNRPQLNAAIALCRRKKAILVIAKLDRLARNVHFVSGLMEAGIEFVACDNPHANRLMVHMLAAFAEHEREMISTRTKAALAAAKARGVRLGVTGKDRARENKAAADDFADHMAPIIDSLVIQEGIKGYEAIAQALNDLRIPSARGGHWHRQTVKNLMERLGNRWG